MSPHSKTRVLLVDDDEETREMLATLMRAEALDFEVTSVESAEDAFGLIRERSFNLYILDYMLAGMSGVEFCVRIRESDSRTPVVIFTATGDPYVRDLALEAGANAFLRKPRDFERLANMVRQMAVSSKEDVS